ncbi:MAG: ATP-dependent Zn protease [Cyanobacteria bacterium J06614_10]
MNPTTLNLLAVSVFAFTILSLVGPLLNISPGAVAIALTGCAGVIAVDRFGAQGKGGTLLIDLVSRQSSEYRQRVLHHEAGHFLVAHLLEIPVQSYTLSAWEAIKAGFPGLGGVICEAPELDAQARAADLSEQQVNRYCTVWMAGIAAENQQYGTAQGGEDDQRKLRQLWIQTQHPESTADTQLRWALLQAQTLIEKQSAAYDALVAAMAERAPVAACCAAIERCRVETSLTESVALVNQD